jgi:hypothetical protein
MIYLSLLAGHSHWDNVLYAVSNIPEDIIYLSLLACNGVWSYTLHALKNIIPEYRKTEKICKLLIMKLGKSAIEYIPIKLVDAVMSDELCKLAIKHIW